MIIIMNAKVREEKLRHFCKEFLRIFLNIQFYKNMFINNISQKFILHVSNFDVR